MEFEGAVVRDKGIHCAIVIVPATVLNDAIRARNTIASFQAEVFRGVPTVLMARGPDDQPIYYGEPQLILRLRQIDPRRLPWRKYELNLRKKRP